MHAYEHRRDTEAVATLQYWEQPSDGEWADVLAAFPLFAGIRKRRLRKLVRQAEVLEFAPGDVVVANGAAVDSLYVVLGGSGTLSGPHETSMLRTGDYFGECAVFNSGRGSPMVRAREELHVMRLPARSFLSLAERESRLSVKGLQPVLEKWRDITKARSGAQCR